SPCTMLTPSQLIWNSFNLTQVDTETVKSQPPYMTTVWAPGRVYGGLPISQAVNAYLTLNPHCAPHTLNYNFIAPVISSVPLEFKVKHLEEGSIATVHVSQSGNTVGLGHLRYNKIVSDYLDRLFNHASEYPSYTECESEEDFLTRVVGAETDFLQKLREFPIEVREAKLPSDMNRIARWTRIKPEYHDSITLNDGVAVIHYLTDYPILVVADKIYRKPGKPPKSLSTLHHQVWMHEDNYDPFAWYLVVAECDIISHGRARVEAQVFDESRKCVMSVVQEGYVQTNTDRKSNL
ncbi:hypothetical protein PMAYCL1PPCAC_16617, partial [Pristionchus mayeri]